MNTALLTGSSLIMSLISMSFQVWLAGRIGSAGIGLYQLVVSVSFLCTTFAISGVRFAATRLVSEEIGREREQGISGAMRRCFVYSALFGTAAFFVLHGGAEMIGFLWIGDARTVRSLRIMAYAMPMVSLCSAMSGYFTACGRVWKPTVVHFFEQIITIALVALFLVRSPAGDIEKNCSAVMLGTICGDAISFVMMLLFYLTDRGRHPGNGKNDLRLTSRMLRIALPLGVFGLCALGAVNARASARTARTQIGRFFGRPRSVRLRDDTGNGHADNIVPGLLSHGAQRTYDTRAYRGTDARRARRDIAHGAQLIKKGQRLFACRCPCDIHFCRQGSG